MRYLLLGCGAIGGAVAAGLVRDGHDVLVCDADPAVVAAINADGLRIEGPVEQFTARPDAISPGELPARIDFPVLVACKQHHTAAAAELLAGRLAGGAFVASLPKRAPPPPLAALPIHEVFDDPAYHPLLLAVAREVLGQAPVRPLPLDGFDPDDLPGSLSRLPRMHARAVEALV